MRIKKASNLLILMQIVLIQLTSRRVQAQFTITGVLNPTTNGTQTFLWNGIASSTSQLNLVLSLTYKNNLVSTPLSPSASVNISCLDVSVPNPKLLFSQPVNLNIQTITTPIAIPFTFSAYGSTLVACSGTITSFPAQQPSGTILFTGMNINSFSSPIYVQPPPSIYFDSNVVDVSYDSTISQSVRIKLRDQVKNSPVSVTCTSTTGSGQLVLNFMPVFVGIGQTQTSIPFNVSALGLASTNVTCTANSQNSVQYVNTMATVVFRLVLPQILLDNYKQILYGSNFHLTLRFQPSVQNGLVYVQCAINEFDTIDQWNQFANNVACPGSNVVQTTSAFAYGTYDNSNYHWYIASANGSYLKSAVYTFSPSTTLNNMQIVKSPQNILQADTVNYLALYCCDITNGSSLIYQQSSIYTTRLSQYLFQVVVQATVAQSNQTFANPYQMKTLLSPAYEPIGVCNCDLTPSVCDIDCCCDNVCTSNDKLAFDQCNRNPTPIPIDKQVNYWNCSNKDALNEDFYPILCFQYSTSAIIGKYYLPANAIAVQNPADFTTYYGDQSSLTSYNSDADISGTITSLTACPTANAYKNGSCVKTAYNDPNNYKLNNGILQFPANIVGHKCLADVPVRFLMDRPKTFCTWELNQDSCSSRNVFDANNYLLSTFLVGNIVGSQPRVLQAPMASSSPVETYVDYYKCPSDVFTDNSQFNAQLVASSSNPNDSCQCQQQASTLIFDKQQTNSCGSNSSKSGPSPSTVSDQYVSDTLGQCQYVSVVPGATPMSPIYNTNSRQCTNIVTRVKYVLFWNGQNIIRILVRIVLSDIGSSSMATQSFEVKWQYYVDSTMQNIVSVSQFEAFLATTKSFQQNQISGGPSGYFMNMPIISGRLVNNAVDTSSANRIAGFLTNSDNLCGQYALRRPVNFGRNISSTCNVVVSSKSFDCACLTSIISHQLNAYYVPSDYVSKVGNLTDFDPANSSWLPVIRQSLSQPAQQPCDNSTGQLVCPSQANMCFNIPSGIDVWFLYADAGKSDGQVIHQIMAVYASRPKSAECWYPVNNTCVNNIFWWVYPGGVDDVFYLYTVNLCLIFGFVSTCIVYVLLFGLKCPC